MKNLTDLIQRKPWVGWVLYGATIVLVFLAGLFGSSIVERRQETNLLYQQTKPIADYEPRNEVWGDNFPLQYESYLNTLDTNFRSKYNGNAKIDMLERHPSYVILWAGYAFARDYDQARGHYYAVQDIRKTLRTDVPQPSTCWTCKSTDVPRVMNKLGVAEFYKRPWNELGHEVVNPIGCQDCHDPKTMSLRITRPALVEAMERRGKDMEKFSHQEMRSLVCAQCHVEYYFDKKNDNYLVFPWDKGTTVEEIEQYYDSIGHVDWVHGLSKTPMLKAQHPDYEIFEMGIHSERGVSCADCHMPYTTKGGVKFTDHQIQSPLNNIANSCQVCHREDQLTLLKNVTDRQDKVMELARNSENTLILAHIEAKTAWESGATEEEMEEVLKLLRQSQWRWDFATAGHGASFHAPLEVARILANALQKGEQARILLARVLMKYNAPYPIAMPDVSTKEKAQAYIGLKMDELRSKKEEFIKNVLPEWDKNSLKGTGDNY